MRLAIYTFTEPSTASLLPVEHAYVSSTSVHRACDLLSDIHYRPSMISLARPQSETEIYFD